MKKSNSPSIIYLSEVPKEHRKLFFDWMIGQTVSGKDKFFRHDYDRFVYLLSKTNVEYTG